MPQSVTIHGELLLPATVLQHRLPDAVQQWLQAAGVLPPHAERTRWRMAPDIPGSYLLAYDVTLPLAEEAP